MTSGKKKGLGRGLSALFGDQTPSENKQVNQTLNKVSISEISRNPYQPRQNFKEEKLEELSNSIKKKGIIQPIAVRINNSGSTKYEIIAGERRWLAAQRAGLHEIPVTILDLSDVESLEVAIVENIQRDDLSPIEEAHGYKRLNEEFKYDHEAISKLMSKSRSHVSNTLRLLTLPSDVVAMLEEGSLTSGQARPLIGFIQRINYCRRNSRKKL
jgi:ParB family chromosome partitioning protein